MAIVLIKASRGRQLGQILPFTVSVATHSLDRGYESDYLMAVLSTSSGLVSSVVSAVYSPNEGSSTFPEFWSMCVPTLSRLHLHSGRITSMHHHTFFFFKWVLGLELRSLCL